MFLRPSPDKIYECFVEVSAPEVSGEGTKFNILYRKSNLTTPILKINSCSG